MKRALVLVAFLLLSCTTTAWAQGAGSAPVGDPRAAGGKCLLPDLSGLTPAQRAAAVLNAGLQMTNLDTVDPGSLPACPATFSCNSITGCGAGSTCSLTVLGPCCEDGGAKLCCSNHGEIVVDQCPCQCVLGTVCSSACASHTNVTVSCFLVPAS